MDKTIYLNKFELSKSGDYEFNASDTIFCVPEVGLHDLQIMSIALHGEAGTLGQAELLRHETKPTVC